MGVLGRVTSNVRTRHTHTTQTLLHFLGFFQVSISIKNVHILLDEVHAEKEEVEPEVTAVVCGCFWVVVVKVLVTVTLLMSH